MFRRRNLEVTFRNYEGGVYAVQDLRRGELEAAVCTEFVLAVQSSRGTELQAIGTIATADNVEGIARADRGTRQPEDLRGRRQLPPGHGNREGAALLFRWSSPAVLPAGPFDPDL